LGIEIMEGTKNEVVGTEGMGVEVVGFGLGVAEITEGAGVIGTDVGIGTVGLAAMLGRTRGEAADWRGRLVWENN